MILGNSGIVDIKPEMSNINFMPWRKQFKKIIRRSSAENNTGVFLYFPSIIILIFYW
jgi:hypothetical protein